MVSNLKTKQLSYWEGKFGDEYIKRNSDVAFFAKRRKFFEKILNQYKINSVLEIGCNVGANLKIILEIKPKLKITGIEPNKKAASIAIRNLKGKKILQKSVFDINYLNKFDLVFTAGVLIHIGDDDLQKALKKIYKASKKYILSIEYYSNKRTTIPYRGLGDALFKRPYDKEYLKLFPKLKIKFKGSLNKSDGFDNCKFWLFEK